MDTTATHLEQIANECSQPENRLKYSSEIPNILSHLKDTDINVVKQALRALCNLAFDCDKNRDLILDNDGIPLILSTFSFDLFDFTCGCILNISMDNELVQQTLVEKGCFEFLKSHQSEIVLQILSNLLEAVDVDVDCLSFLHQTFTREYLDSMLLVLETISEQEKRQMLLFEKIGSVSLASILMDFVDQGLYVHELCGILSTCTLNDKCLYLVSDPIVHRFTSWILFDIENSRTSQIKRGESSGLNSPDHQRHDIRMTGCLCIGNLARSDANCAILTPIVGPSLLKLVEHEMDTLKPNLKTVHAALGALRNFALSQGKVLNSWDTMGIVSRVLKVEDLQALYTTAISILKNISIDLDQVFQGTVQLVCNTVWELPSDIDIGVRTETARFIVALVRRIHESKQFERAKELVDCHAVGLVIQSISGGFMSGELKDTEIDKSKVFPSVQNEAIVCLVLLCSSMFL